MSFFEVVGLVTCCVAAVFFLFCLSIAITWKAQAVLAWWRWRKLPKQDPAKRIRPWLQVQNKIERKPLSKIANFPPKEYPQ